MRIERVVFAKQKTNLQLGIAASGANPKLVALLEMMLAHEFLRHRDSIRAAEPPLDVEATRVETRGLKGPESGVGKNVDAENFEIIAAKIRQRNKPMHQRRRRRNSR